MGDQSVDQPQPSRDEVLPQPDRPLGTRDIVNKLTELVDHPKAGAKWAARRVSGVRPIPATPNSPYSEHWEEGRVAEELLVAQAFPENPKTYTSSYGSGILYREGEQVAEGREVARDEAGEIKGISRVLTHTTVYAEPESIPKSDISIIGNIVTVGPIGQVTVERIIMDPTQDQARGQSIWIQELNTYGRGEPERQELIGNLYRDLDASVDHPASIPPTQPAPAV